MAAQAFFYNAIFFTYALVLTDFYDISSDQVGWYLLPFAIGNFLGPLLLGRLFDTIGRRPMIATTYALSGLLLALTGALFAAGFSSATAQTAAWTLIFFFASAAASSAYLTVSETFPLEIRALSIAFFYAVGTGIGGVGAMAVRRLDRHGLQAQPVCRVFVGRGSDACRRAHRAPLWRRRRAEPLEAVATPLSAAD
jgi:MFS family permease